MNPLLTHAVPALTAPIPEGTDIHALRSRLPLLSAVARRLSREQEAIAQFGLAYSWEEMGTRLREYLPRRIFRYRTVRCQRIELYSRDIPDAALAAWDRAVQSGFFREFCIAEPTYEDRAVSVDPWLIGWLGLAKDAPGMYSHWNEGRGIILAYWE